MDRILRGTRSERGRQVRLSSIVSPCTLPILMIQVGGVPLLLLLQMCCLEGGGGVEASFYSLQGRFLPSPCMETLATALRKSRGYSSSKCIWTGGHIGSVDPRWRLPSSTFLWLAIMWAQVVILGDSCLDAPVCSARWALESVCQPLIGQRCVSWTLGLICCGPFLYV
jgi:hypothetical protein